MFHPLAAFIGLRYTRARGRRNHFVSFVSATAMLGVAVGIAVLITVLSVMNGFEKELRARILEVVAHATVFDTTGPVRQWQALLGRLSGEAGVLGAAPFIRAAAMLSHRGRASGVIVHGVVPQMEDRVTGIGARMRAGHLAELQAGRGCVVIGRVLAEKLGLGQGEGLTLIAPRAAAEPNTGVVPDLRRYTVCGIFDLGMYEYDASLALLHLEDAAELFGTAGAVSGIRLRLEDAYGAPRLVRSIAQRLGPQFAVIDWTQFYVNFFKALKSQKAMMFVIVTLIVAVAAFNIVATLVMVVNDKRGDIAVLRTLGLSPRRVMAVFVVQGLAIGVAGTLAGALAGVGLARNIETVAEWLEGWLGIDLLPAEVYYLNRLPSEVQAGDVGAVCAMAFGLCLAATLYPAWRAARTPPAEALRYE